MVKKTLGIITATALATIIIATSVKNYKLNPNVTQENIQETICKSGWTATVRPPVSYTNQLKLEQLKDKTFIDKNPKHYEEDHRVPLELGGDPKDPHNLIPQLYTNSVDGILLGAREKDIVESYLHEEVCGGKITLKDAQDKIVNHWAEIYLQIKGYKIDPSTTDE